MPSETFRHAATTEAEPTTIWSALNRPSTWEAVPGVDRVYDPVIDDTGRLRGFLFESVAAGKTFIGRASPADRVEETAMAWDILTTELKGLVRVDIEKADDVTQVAVSLAVEAVGMLSAIFFPVIVSSIGNGFEPAVELFVVSLG